MTSGGKGDWIFSARSEYGSISVPAARLSDQLPDLSRFDAVFLRMNIEGAERDVIDDPRPAGLLPSISDLFDMWDDLSKIDPAADDGFR